MLVWPKKTEHYKIKKYNIFWKYIYIKTEKTVIRFGDIEIEKQKFHQRKRPFSIKNIDTNKIVASKKVFCCKKGFKHFIGYKDAKIRPLCIFLPKMSAYRRDFDETK